MNLKKSMTMAMAITGIQNKQIAGELSTTPQQVSSWCIKGAISQVSIIKLAQVFDMKVSEFIALGEG